MEAIKKILLHKFNEIERRLLQALDQLNDEQANWRPNESSNSIANLVVHIQGNIRERISRGIRRVDAARDREAEFEELFRTKLELAAIVRQSFAEVRDTVSLMSDDEFAQTQLVRNAERTHLEVLVQCATHFSEHMGQVLYIGKMLKGDEYVTTSIAKKPRGG
ncbi:DUF1572 family protein [Paenibacillus silvisoli]|uniref:DUF1572 family protein n=1 Tax=Paenibacillus silvisoli TaxID=3110539 RepID=UPI00280418F3|nr:DUF1572 family protein [Paenibacillus silvisoli]